MDTPIYKGTNIIGGINLLPENVQCGAAFFMPFIAPPGIRRTRAAIGQRNFPDFGKVMQKLLKTRR
ncbi:hypothetical protein [Asticcacaulis solisilvae]|uniref:hypothetical protein n=1 Tax=Asticcacaulis solisilvae TaxID=1217274 RepID=UPI003FD88166